MVVCICMLVFAPVAVSQYAPAEMLVIVQLVRAALLAMSLYISVILKP